MPTEKKTAIKLVMSFSYDFKACFYPQFYKDDIHALKYIRYDVNGGK